jgi:hypothetical protein
MSPTSGVTPPCSWLAAVTSLTDPLQLRYPPELGDLGDKQLCLDAEHEGNEMRFVNSVAPTTAFYIRQNATMSTLWCRNQVCPAYSACLSCVCVCGESFTDVYVV